MKKSIIRIFSIFLMSILLLFLNNMVEAASLTLPNYKEVEVGKTVSITVGNGVTGRVDISSSNSSVVTPSVSKLWIENGTATFNITAKSKGTATITVTAISLASAEDGTKVSGSKQCNITVKEKEQEKPKTETPTQTTTQKPTNTQTSNKTNTTKKANTTKKNEQNKTKTEVVATEEKEEATPLWGINEVKLIGVKENGEKVDLQLDKTFNITTYDYLCNVSSDIKRIEVQKEAYEYNDFVTITGIEEDLKDGENIITLKLAKEGQKELIYTIKVNKEAKPQEVQTSTEVIEEEKKDTYVCIKLWKFILLEIVIVAVAVIITFLITKKIISDKANFQDSDDKRKE